MSAKKGRKHSLSRPAGPTRIHNKRQQKIVKMVDGYDSTFTLAVALRNVLLVWTMVGAALIIVGLMAASTSSSSVAGESAGRLLGAVRAGPILLFLLTALISTAWVTRSRMNVKHLGKSPKVGVWARIKTHVGAFFAGFFALLLAFIIPSLAPLLVFVAIVSWFYAQLWLHLLMMDTVRMLWRTSSAPTGQEEDVSHYVLVWLVSWIVFSATFFAEEVRTISQELAGVLSMVEGLACIVAAVTGAKIVTDISRRQDERLYAIISNVEGEPTSVGPVTNHQIQDAWQASESLVDLPSSH